MCFVVFVVFLVIPLANQHALFVAENGFQRPLMFIYLSYGFQQTYSLVLQHEATPKKPFICKHEHLVDLDLLKNPRKSKKQIPKRPLRKAKKINK